VKSSALFVEMPGGIRIAVEQDFDGLTLRRLVAALGRSSAMFGLGAATHIYVATGATTCGSPSMALQPGYRPDQAVTQSGHLFLFANKRKDA